MADLDRMNAAELEEYRHGLQEQIENLRYKFVMAGFELERKRKLGNLEAQREHIDREIQEEQAKVSPDVPKPEPQVVGLKRLSLKGVLKLLGKGE